LCVLAAIVIATVAAAWPSRALYAHGPAPGQAQPPISFSRTVYPIFESAQCRGCHTDDGVASATRLHFPEPNASPEEIEAFGITLAALVDRADPARSLLINKPTNRERHTGGVRIQPGSFDEEALVEWVRHLAGLPEAAVAAARDRLAGGTAASAPKQVLRRLTHSQYNNTVRDLLGDHSRPADRFPPEDFVNGFKNQLRTQGMPPLLAEAYGAAAEKLALNAFRAGDVHALLPCKPTSARDVRCRDQFVQSFGLRAFRRPLSGVELRRYAALFTAQAAKTGQFLDGARIVVEAMLQSPKFLFHVESRAEAGSTGGGFRDYEVASRLAYFLWDTMPDRRLFEAAANGELRTADGIERLARSMLDQPSARQAVDEFFAQWLRFDRVLGSVKDRRRFPEFTPELAAMMVQETRMLLDNLVWKDGNFMEAFTADYSFLNADLASLYGMPAPSGEFELVRFPADSHRSERGTGRDLTDRARHLHPRAVAVPARAESAARREYPGAGADRRPSAGEAAAHAGARREPDLRELSPPDGSDRLRAGKLRRVRPLEGHGSDRVRDQRGQGKSRQQDHRAADRRQRRDRRSRELGVLRARSHRTSAGRKPRVPGVHRQAALPLRVRPHGDDRRSRDGSEHVCRIPRVTIQVQGAADCAGAHAAVSRWTLNGD